MKNHITIATRESPLALWQANWVKTQLEKIYPALNIHLLGMTTEADRLLETPLTLMGGKGVFVKELEESLLDKRADIAVHSMKDVPMVLPSDLCIPVMCERFDPRDVFVSNEADNFFELKKDEKVGTSSLRRQSQLRALRSDLAFVSLRGNVETRLKKLDKGEFQAIILAASGLKRLNLESRIRSYLSLEKCIPAPGQGALGIECRENDEEIQQIIHVLNHEVTFITVSAERAMCRKLGGGCQVPIGAYAEMKEEKIFLRGLVAEINGVNILRAEGLDSNPEKLGNQVADALLAQGAGAILNGL